MRVLARLGVLQMNGRSAARAALRRRGAKRGLDGKELDTYVGRHDVAAKQRRPPSSSLLARPPGRIERLVDPYDPKQDPDVRARSYLHANCAICHVEAGGGNAQIDLAFTTSRERMKLFDVKPLHRAFDLPDALLVAPGAPERSVLLHRVSIRERGRMPPLASSIVDRRAVELLRRWIRQMDRSGK